MAVATTVYAAARQVRARSARPLASSGTATPLMVRPRETTPTLSVAEAMIVTGWPTLTGFGLTDQVDPGAWVSALDRQV